MGSTRVCVWIVGELVDNSRQSRQVVLRLALVIVE